MSNLNEKQIQLLQAYADANPTATSFTRQEMFSFAEEQGVTGSTAYTMMKILPIKNPPYYLSAFDAASTLKETN